MSIAYGNFHVVDRNGNTRKLVTLHSDEDISISSDNQRLPSNVHTLKDVIDNLGSLAFADNIQMPVATTSAFGVVKLNNSTTDTTATNTVATTAALATVNSRITTIDQGSIHTSGNETIYGLKSFEDGIIISGFKFYPQTDPVSGEITLMVEPVNND